MSKSDSTAMMRLENMMARSNPDTDTTVVDRLMEFVDAIPRDAPVDAVFDGFQKVRDDTAPLYDVVREIVAITRDDRVARLNDEVKMYAGLAEKWAAKPDLNIREACHGVAHDAYAIRFDTSIHRPTPEGPFNPSKVYGANYSLSLEEEIKGRTMRSAKELFGTGKGHSN